MSGARKKQGETNISVIIICLQQVSTLSSYLFALASDDLARYMRMILDKYYL